MRKVTNFPRCNFSRKSVPVNYVKHISDKSNILKYVYKEGIYEFEFENVSPKKKRPVVYADAEELLEAVIEERNLEGNVIIEAMANGGQGFFKISLTILPEACSPQEDNFIHQSENDNNNSSLEN